MDLLKKYWDKILLALVLLALISMAVWLMISVEAALKQLAGGTDLYASRGATVEPIDPSPITNATHLVGNPVGWAGNADPFLAGPYVPPVVDTNRRPAEVEEVIRIEKIDRIPFKLLFMDYSWDPEQQQGSNFQINFQFRSRTFIVPRLGDYIKDLFENTGYKTIAFERKEDWVMRQGFVDRVLTDVSELRIQFGNEDPITLVRGREALEREPVATIVCEPGWPMPSSKYQVRRGQQFKCGAKTYIVVDITSRQMIIKDTKTEEQRIIPLGGDAR